MYRARTDDDDESTVGSVQDRPDCLPARLDEGERMVIDRDLFLQQRRRDQRSDRTDAHVVDARRVQRAGAVTGFSVVSRIVERRHAPKITSLLTAAPRDSVQEGSARVCAKPRSGAGPSQRKGGCWDELYFQKAQSLRTTSPLAGLPAVLSPSVKYGNHHP